MLIAQICSIGTQIREPWRRDRTTLFQEANREAK